MRKQLALALGKERSEFSEYQAAVKAIDEAKKQADHVLDHLQREERYSWLRGVAREAVLVLVSLVVPGASIPLSNDQVVEKAREILDEGTRVGVEQLKRVWSKLYEKLGDRLSDYLEAPLRLGIALGHDLAQFAKKQPMLIFFDTYEEIDEGDKLLQICMGAAGDAVGWVISGRDNLWAGLAQVLRSPYTEYGYKDLVIPDRSMVVDFRADGVGDFTLSDIEEYFTILCQRANWPWLPADSKKNAARIQEVTRGVPLAVKIVASLYLEKPDLARITEGLDGKREIVEQMVKRYLIQTRTNPSDRARLYGLALLRRVEDPTVVAAALNVSQGLEAELSRLHRRYGFIFTMQGKPALHQEVRYFLRLWLLQYRTMPEIVQVIHRLRDTLSGLFVNMEGRRHYTSLRTRLEDDQWVELYLDWTEQEFWLDPVKGFQLLLPFMFAASIYRREANREARILGRFFQDALSQPYRRHWAWADQSLVYNNSRRPLPDEFSGLKDLVRLSRQTEIAFPAPLPGYREEIEAALWWRLAEAYRGQDVDEAVHWYEKAQSRLTQEKELREAYTEALWDRNHVSQRGEPGPAVSRSGNEYLQRGREYRVRKDFESAIRELSVAIERDTALLEAYIERGYAYLAIAEPREAIGDFDQALNLDPNNIEALKGRGKAYQYREEFQRAIEDFDRVLQLVPNDTDIVAMRQAAIGGRGKYTGSLPHLKSGSSRRARLSRRTALAIIAASGVGMSGMGFLLWKLVSSSQLSLQNIYLGHKGSVEGVSWSPDGRRFTSAGYDKTVRIWNATTAKELLIYSAHTDAVWRAQWSPDGQYIASGGDDGTVHVWHALTGQTILVYKGHSNVVRGVAWSLDGKRIASASHDGTVHIWQAVTGKLLVKLDRHKQGVENVTWSPDGKRVAAANYDGTVTIWDGVNGRLLVVYSGHDIYAVYTVVWSPDGNSIASGSADKTVQIWGAATGKSRFILDGYHDSVWGLDWSPNGRYLASASKDGSVKIWDASTGHLISMDAGDENDFAYSVAWAPDSRYLLSSYKEGIVRLWSV